MADSDIMAGLHAFVKAKANSGSAVEIEMNEPAPEVPGLCHAGTLSHII